MGQLATDIFNAAQAIPPAPPATAEGLLTGPQLLAVFAKVEAAVAALELLTRGSRILTTTGVPNNTSDGENGDLAINQATADLYAKAGGTWAVVFSLKGTPGKDATGGAGLSAYQLAVQQGFNGSLTQWLASLASPGSEGKSAYQLAQAGGFTGTVSQWLDSLKGVGSPGQRGNTIRWEAYAPTTEPAIVGDLWIYNVSSLKCAFYKCAASTDTAGTWSLRYTTPDPGTGMSPAPGTGNETFAGLTDDPRQNAALAGYLDGKADVTALALKADLVAGKVPAAQLPSYVDDVLEFATFTALPATGETGKIYVTLDTNFEYRWSGSTYIQLVASPGSTDAVPEGTKNLYFTILRVLGTTLAGYVKAGAISAVLATDTLLAALGKLEAKADANTSALQNTVNLSGDQSVAGKKTFAGPLLVNGGPYTIAADFIISSAFQGATTRGVLSTTGSYADFCFEKPNASAGQINQWNFGLRYDTSFGNQQGSFQIVGVIAGGSKYLVPFIANPDGTVIIGGNGVNSVVGKVGIGVNPTEALEVGGNVKAAQFIGDGSRLTGLSTYDDTTVRGLIKQKFQVGYVPGTLYKAGDEIISPDGTSRVAAIGDFAAGAPAAYNSAQWVVVDAVLSLAQATSILARTRAVVGLLVDGSSVGYDSLDIALQDANTSYQQLRLNTSGATVLNSNQNFPSVFQGNGAIVYLADGINITPNPATRPRQFIVDTFFRPRVGAQGTAVILISALLSGPTPYDESSCAQWENVSCAVTVEVDGNSRVLFRDSYIKNLIGNGLAYLYGSTVVGTIASTLTVIDRRPGAASGGGGTSLTFPPQSVRSYLADPSRKYDPLSGVLLDAMPSGQGPCLPFVDPTQQKMYSYTCDVNGNSLWVRGPIG